MTLHLALVSPSLDRLPAYAAALAAGWSPSSTWNVSATQLAAIRQDGAAFLHELTRQDGTIQLPDGQIVPRLPNRQFWMWDGEFCGAINLRFQPGTTELPPTASGHIGYGVVPWKQRRGYATQALAAMLPIARDLGLPCVQLTCDETNAASRRVIESNGGTLTGRWPPKELGKPAKLVFWIEILS